MPELPEVENYKRFFEKTSLNQKIKNVYCEDDLLIDNKNISEFKKELTDEVFESVKRRGKFLIITLEDSDLFLVQHFGMTGNLEYITEDEEGSDYAHIRFNFKDDGELRWLCRRKFGRNYLVNELSEISLLDEMGPEPLKLDYNSFNSLLDDYSRRAIKSFLLDQRCIAGIGNIYSDELLFRAGIKPDKKIKSLTNEDRKRVYDCMISVLEEGIENIINGDDFPNDWLFSHRNDMKCPNDNNEMKNIRVSGRSTYFCPKCQE